MEYSKDNINQIISDVKTLKQTLFEMFWRIDYLTEREKIVYNASLDYFNQIIDKVKESLSDPLSANEFQNEFVDYFNNEVLPFQHLLQSPSDNLFIDIETNGADGICIPPKGDINHCFIGKLRQITVNSKKNYESAISSAKAFISNVADNSLSIITPFNLSLNPTTEQINSFFNKFSNESKSHFALPVLPFSFTKDVIQGNTIYSQVGIRWQQKGNKLRNLFFEYNENNKEHCYQIIYHILMNAMLYFPVSKVHLNVINFSFSRDMSPFIGNLDKALYTHITTEEQFRGLIKNIQERLQDDLVNAKSEEEINADNGYIAKPYEFIIIPNYSDILDKYKGELIPIIENCYECGIYFIITQQHIDGKDCILNNKDFFFQLDKVDFLENQYENKADALIQPISIAHNQEWSKAAFQYFNDNVTKDHKNEVKTETKTVEIQTGYLETSADIKAAIGVDLSGIPVDFQLDTSDHIHAFVMGKSGSGKSRFLHTIITSMTNLYSSEDLELYLLDFKGVEFQCYKDLPHTRVALAFGEDECITSEIIKDLRNQMRLRSQLLNECGVTKIAEYNIQHPDKRIPQIVFIADECQHLFTVKDRSIQADVIDTLDKIAREGRSSGIHMVLCTQNINDLDNLKKSIRSQLTEKYFLPCFTSDACKMIESSKQNDIEKSIEKLTIGQCLYLDSHSNFKTFRFNYIPGGDKQRELLEGLIKKSAGHTSNGQSYFNGKSRYYIDESVVCALPAKLINASAGITVSMSRTPINIDISNTIGQNILILGHDDFFSEMQSFINVLWSLIIINKSKNLGFNFIVIDCLNDNSSEYYPFLRKIEEEECCKIVGNQAKIETLRQIYQDIKSNNVQQTFVCIIGQQYFEELRENKKFEKILDITKPKEEKPAMSSIFDGIEPLSIPQLGGLKGMSSDKDADNLLDVIKYILIEGPQKGVHTLMSLSQPSQFLFDKMLNKREMFSFFSHSLIHYMSIEDGRILYMDDKNIFPHKINNDEKELVRAYYYNSDNNKSTLYIPFAYPNLNN